MRFVLERLLGRRRDENSATTDSNTKLGEQKVSFAGVFVAINLLDKSIGNQAIKSRPFIRVEFFGSFDAPRGDDVRKDREFVVGEGGGCCH
jgi:hypothetical protein